VIPITVVVVLAVPKIGTRGNHDGAWDHHSWSAVVDTAVVAVTATSACGAAVEAGTASASNKND
jgi:hypothetical protein